MNLVFQAVIWPLRLASGWPVRQAVWLAVSVAGWSLLTGLLIAWGRGSNAAARRTVAMLACVGVVVAEPLLQWLAWRVGVSPGVGGVGEASMRLSPLQAFWHLTAGGIGPRSVDLMLQRQGPQVLSVAAAAAAGWVMLLTLLTLARRRGPSRS